MPFFFVIFLGFVVVGSFDKEVKNIQQENKIVQVKEPEPIKKEVKSEVKEPEPIKKEVKPEVKEPSAEITTAKETSTNEVIRELDSSQNSEKSYLKLFFYIIGAILSVIGAYVFFRQRKSVPSNIPHDYTRSNLSQEVKLDTTEQQPVQEEEVKSDTTEQQPVQEEEVKSDTTEQQPVQEEEVKSDTTEQQPVQEEEVKSDTTEQQPVQEEEVKSDIEEDEKNNK